MKNSTENRVEGAVHEAKGATKEKLGTPLTVPISKPMERWKNWEGI